MKKALAASLVALMLAGCGHKEVVQVPVFYPQKSYQAVRVTTPGVEGATCSLRNASSQYTLVTPGSVTVENSGHPLVVSCEKGDHFRGRAQVEPRKLVPMEGGDYVQYVYPFNVNVPLGLNAASLKTEVRVF